MTRELTDSDYLAELEPVATDALNQHLSRSVHWYPHDYVPWANGKNFAAAGGEEWDP